MSKDSKKKHHWGTTLLRTIGLKRKHDKGRTFSNNTKKGNFNTNNTARYKSIIRNPDDTSLLKRETYTDSVARGSQKATSSLAPSQGVFNIPIVIDPMETNKLEKTNTSLTLGSLKGHCRNGNSNSNSNSVPSLSLQSMEKKKLGNERRQEAMNQNAERTPDSPHPHTAFETFLTFAHNAVGHIPKINIQEADGSATSKHELKDRKESSSNTSGAPSDKSTNDKNTTSIKGSDGPFLKNLDDILAASASSTPVNQQLNATETESKNKLSSLSKSPYGDLKSYVHADSHSNSNLNSRDDISSENSRKQANATARKVVFEPIRNSHAKPTPGVGNLRLEHFNDSQVTLEELEAVSTGSLAGEEHFNNNELSLNDNSHNAIKINVEKKPIPRKYSSKFSIVAPSTTEGIKPRRRAKSMVNTCLLYTSRCV